MHFDVAVLGGGAIGTAAAWHVAQRGLRTAVIEQFEVGHENGSSHGHSRIIRLSYDHPDYIKLSKAVYPMWRELEEATGTTLFTKTGGLDLSWRGDPRIDACATSMSEENVPFDLLDVNDVKRLFPQFSISSDVVGLYQQETGILDATLCVKTTAQAAERRGAKFFTGTRVQSINASEEAVTLKTTVGEISCGHLIVTTGAWTGPLLEPLGISLPFSVTQEQFAYFKPRNPEKFEIGKFPVFIFYGDLVHNATSNGSGGISCYGFPPFGLPGVKAAFHQAGKDTTADTRDFRIDEAKMRLLQDVLVQFLPDLEREPFATGTCLYTVTPDRHFVLDHVPGLANVTLGAGFSGHAFKFSLTLGKMLSELSLDGCTNYPSQLFKINRFDLKLRSATQA